jgi:hypothetical protein
LTGQLSQRLEEPGLRSGIRLRTGIVEQQDWGFSAKFPDRKCQGYCLLQDKQLTLTARQRCGRGRPFCSMRRSAQWEPERAYPAVPSWTRDCRKISARSESAAQPESTCRLPASTPISFAMKSRCFRTNRMKSC